MVPPISTDNTYTRHLFTDGSVNPQSKVGYGAYLIVDDLSLSPETQKEKVQIKRFTHTSSTQLELETLLWALQDITASPSKLYIYTDCQNIIGLSKRRGKINHADSHKKHDALYQSFFTLQDHIGFEVVKIQGHKRTCDKNTIEKLFTLVDKASRQALRQAIKEKHHP